MILAAPEFQMTQYKKREWVSRILADCSEKEAAFGNWMQRDILFARQVKSDCVRLGIPYLMNDGAQSIDRFYQSVKDALGLERGSDNEALFVEEQGRNGRDCGKSKDKTDGIL